MVARWRVAKDLKILKERRARPRSLGVNWHNGTAVKTGSIDLELEGRVAEEMETRKPRAPSIQEIGVTFNNLRHFNYIKNTFMKVDFYFTPKKDAYYIVCYFYREKVVRVSLSYSSKDRAVQAWTSDKVKWKFKRNIL